MFNTFRFAAQSRPALLNTPQVIHRSGQIVLLTGNPGELKAVAANLVERPLVQTWKWHVRCQPHLHGQCLQVTGPELQDGLGRFGVALGMFGTDGPTTDTTDLIFRFRPSDGKAVLALYKPFQS
ncbi:hypothetical protein D3C73_846030 [compost metagenome]